MVSRLRVLLISASMPPHWDSQCIRTLYLLRKTEELGVEWAVVTPGPPHEGSHPCSALLPGSVRWEHTEPVPLVQMLAAHRANKSRLSWIAVNWAWRTAYPDYGAGWQGLALAKSLEVVRSWKPHLVVSASGSVTAHIAASELSNRTGLPWVADYGDPWHLIDRRHRPWLAWRSAREEPRVLSRASRVFFTTRDTLHAYRSWLGDRLPPAEALPYGWLESDFEGIEPDAGDGPLVASHVGVAFRGNRNLEPLIEAIHDLRDQSIALEIAGDHSPSFERRAAELGASHVSFEGKLGYDEANRRIRRCGLFVVVGNKSPLQVPGKTYVGIGSGKPVLYIAQRPLDGDPSWAVLKGLPGVLACSNDRESIRHALLEVLVDRMEWARAAARRPHLPEARASEASNLSARFLEVIREVAEGRSCMS